jgi:RecA-family ATPase
MVGERIPDDVIFTTLRTWIPDADKKDKELRELIHGAHELNPTPAGLGCGPSIQRNGQKFTFKSIAPSRIVSGDLPSIQCSWTEFLRRAYYPSEKIFIATDAEWNEAKGKWDPTGKLQGATLEQWLTGEEPGPKSFNPEAGCWIAINPFKEWEHRVNGEYAGKRVQDNVSAFRYVMFESDTRTKAQQFADINASNLPIAFVIDSGGDSLHAWARVDAKDADQWKSRRDAIYEVMKDCGIDRSNKDGSRLSRLPGVKRGESFQSLVAENIGAKDWATWEAEANVQPDTTEWFSHEDLMEFDRENDPDSVIGNRWLCKGGSLVIQGYSGIGKSSFALQMALSWSVGRDFFGLGPDKPLRTVLIQAENDKGDTSEPYQDILATFTKSQVGLVSKNFQIGREATACGAERFAAKVRQMIGDFKPDIIFCDPLLSYFGSDISKQEQASKFFRQYLQPIQNETGIIIVFVHHLGKPPQNGQRQGPSHYHGLGSSDIINWTRETLMLTQEGDTFVMELGKRDRRAGFKEKYVRQSATGVRWEEANGIENRTDAKSHAERQKRENLRGFIVHHGIVTLTQMKDRARDFGYSKNTIKDALEALAQNDIGSDEPVYAFEAHVNGGKRLQAVYSIRPKPENERIESKDIDSSTRITGRIKGENR